MTVSNSRTTLFVAYGSVGDIYPMLAIAQQLKARGERVLFVANEYFAEAVRRADVPYAQAGTRQEQLAARETATSNGDTFKGAMVRYDYIIGCNYARVSEILNRLHAAGQQLLVVTHGFMSPAFPACEALGIPIVITFYAPSQIPENREDYVLYRTGFGRSEWFARHIRFPLNQIRNRFLQSPYPRYNKWREKAGYPRCPGPIASSIRGLLAGRGWRWRHRHPCVVLEMALFPQWYGEPIGRDISDIEHVGFVFHSDPDERNNALVDSFIAAHGAPVVFTPGTAVEDTEDFCGAISETCRLLDAPAIVLSRYVAESLAKFDFAACGARVLALDHVDLGYLLPRARLLVHHGGIGTLAQAVRAGIPQIIRPRMYDQPMNGVRVAMNGLGGMCYDDGYNGEEIADVYRHITGSELHRERLAYYRDLTQRENGAATAAGRILDCLQAADHEPAPTTQIEAALARGEAG